VGKLKVDQSTERLSDEMTKLRKWWKRKEESLRSRKNQNVKRTKQLTMKLKKSQGQR